MLLHVCTLLHVVLQVCLFNNIPSLQLLIQVLQGHILLGNKFDTLRVHLGVLSTKPAKK